MSIEEDDVNYTNRSVIKTLCLVVVILLILMFMIAITGITLDNKVVNSKIFYIDNKPYQCNSVDIKTTIKDIKNENKSR